jgi:hypothetical protein
MPAIVEEEIVVPSMNYWDFVVVCSFHAAEICI